MELLWTQIKVYNTLDSGSHQDTEKEADLYACLIKYKFQIFILLYAPITLKILIK